MTALLADPDFRRLWLAGATVSALRWLDLLAIGLYVLERTGSPSMVALITVLRLAPMFLCGFLIGALGDRYERRSLLLWALVLLAAASTVLAMLALTDRLALWQIAIGAFLAGLFVAADISVRRVMTAEIAGPKRLSHAVALESIGNNATRMLGPALGGLLLETLGLPGVYLAGALIYLLGAMWVLRSHYRRTGTSGQEPGFLTALREGWSYVRAHRVIAGTLGVTLVANFWAMSYVALVPVVGDDVLGLSAFANGVLMSMLGVGAFVGALLASRMSQSRAYSWIFLASSVVVTFAVLGFGLSVWFSLSLTINLICGICIGIFSVIQSSILILAARPEVRSRVMGVLTVSIGAGQFAGMLHMGWLAEWLGAASAIQLSAIEGLIGLALVALIWPEMRRATDLAARRVP